MNKNHQMESLVSDFDRFVEQKNWLKLKETLLSLPAVDIAELLEDMEPELGVVIFRLLQKPKAGDVFAYLSTTKGQELLESFTRQQLSDVMDNLEPDEQVAIRSEEHTSELQSRGHLVCR